VQIQPGQGISGLQFGASEPEALQFFDATRVTTSDHGDGRSAVSIQEWRETGEGPGLLFLEGEGLISISLYRGPAFLWDQDLFALPLEQLGAQFRERGHTPEITGPYADEADWAFPELGLILYTSEDEVEQVEVFAGLWWRGKRLDAPGDREK